MTTKEQQLKSDVYDFFIIQFDEKTAKQVKKNPDRAMPILREFMNTNHVPHGRLRLFQEAIENLLELYELNNEK